MAEVWFKYKGSDRILALIEIFGSTPFSLSMPPIRETGFLRMILSIVCLITCAQVACAQHTDAQGSSEDCGEPIPNTQDSFCSGPLRGLANTLNPYGTEHPDILRKQYASHPVCAMCPCGVDPVVPESEADELVRIREFLAVSPQKRLKSALEAGDFRFLGAPGFSGLYVPCTGHPVSRDILHVMPQTLNVQLSDEHAELNRRIYEYARQYNHLLVNWLVCSGDIPLPEASRQRLGIRCDSPSLQQVVR